MQRDSDLDGRKGIYKSELTGGSLDIRHFYTLGAFFNQP